MKKITLILLALVSFNFGTAQFVEDFSGTAFPPTGWTQYPGTNGLGTTVTWGLNDPATPAFALCLWEDVTGGLAEDWLVTPSVAINATQNVLTFDATDFNQPDFGSVLSIRVSTTSQTDMTTFVEVENLDESELGNNANAVFTGFNVNLAAYINQNVFVAFVLIQDDGDAVAIDNVEFIAGAAAVPGVANTPTPADMATGVAVDLTDVNGDGAPDNSVLFGWAPDSSLGSVAPDDYQILLGDSPTTLASLGVAPATITLPTRITGLVYNTTYFWQIIPRNTAGPAVNAPIWSFTTEVGAISAPNDVTTPTPADMATNVVIDAANTNAVTIAWTAATTGDAAESYVLLLGNSPSTLNVLGATPNLTVNLTNMLAGTTYFWQVQPRNVGGTNTTTPVWQFTTAGTASVDDQVNNLFTISPNPASDFINIQSNEVIANVTIYNGLGQLISDNVEVQNNQIKVNTLSAGLYLLKLDTDKGSTDTIQFIKK